MRDELDLPCRRTVLALRLRAMFPGWDMPTCWRLARSIQEAALEAMAWEAACQEGFAGTLAEAEIWEPQVTA